MTKPKLSIYVGESQISILKFESPENYEFYSYPYTPLNYLRHTKTDSEFIGSLLKRFGIKRENYDIVIGGSIGENVATALKSIHNFSWFLIESFTLATPSDYISFFPYSEYKNDDDFINYFSNKSLYPQIIPGRREEYDMEESFLKKISEEVTHKYNYDLPIIFTGGKFFGTTKDKAIVYLSALGFLRESGLYNVMIDSANKLPAISLINQNAGTLAGDIMDGSWFHDEFINVGTVLRSHGKVECLFEKSDSSPQFIEVDKEEIFILPLKESETARVSISSGKLGKIERNIRGGDIGFIIDTRSNLSDSTNPEWVGTFEERLNSF